MIKLATLFSGVGAIEEAFVKKGMKHKIVFAADNGERECKINVEEVKQITSKMSVKEKNEYIEKLYLELSKKENYNRFARIKCFTLSLKCFLKSECSFCRLTKN